MGLESRSSASRVRPGIGTPLFKAGLVSLCLSLIFLPAGGSSRGLFAVQTSGKTVKKGQTTVPVAQPQPQVPTLASARKELSGMEAGKAFAARLEQLAAGLSPSEGLALLAEFAGRAPSASRQALWTKAASLSLLLGRFGEAALHFESAAGEGSGEKDQALLLRAARCRVASGDTPRARELAAESRSRAETAAKLAGAGLPAAKGAQTSPAKPTTPKGQTGASGAAKSGTTPKPSPAPKPDSLPDPALLKPARIRADIVEAWSWLVEGESPRCVDLVRPIINDPARGAAKGSAERREALFILWNSASAKERSDAAGMLRSEYPDSPEAGIVRGNVKNPPLAHWLLGVLSASLQAPAPERMPADVAKTTGTGSAAAAQLPAKDGRVTDRLQVGYFSREENAKAFRQELASKGFSAYVEARPEAGGLPRWAVTVDVQAFPESATGSPASQGASSGGSPVSNLQATQIRLKELGYESYPVE